MAEEKTAKLAKQAKEETAEKSIPLKLVKAAWPELRSGYTIRIHQRIKEGKKERVQVYEGIIIALRGKTTATKTMTVYKESHGVGVEKIYPLSLPTIEKVEVVKKAKVRRAKLYFIKRPHKRISETKKK